MVRFRVVVAAIVVWAAAGDAGAQNNYNLSLTGHVTGHIGGVQGGDTRGRNVTPGVSMAVIEKSGLGAEIDLAHSRSFDPERFAESGVTTFMLNVIGMGPHAKYKPFGLGGVGVMRVRAAVLEGAEGPSRTDMAFNAGGGMLVLFNEAFGLRADVRYYRYFQRFADVPLLDNGFFDFYRVSVGATFSWPIK